MLSAIRPSTGPIQAAAQRTDQAATPDKVSEKADTPRVSAATPVMSGEAVSRALAIFAPMESQAITRAETGVSQSVALDPATRARANLDALQGYGQLSGKMITSNDTRL